MANRLIPWPARNLVLVFGILWMVLSSARFERALASDSSSIDWSQISLEELGTIKITVASKTPEPVSDAASAVFVITQEDIRRSGATSIPEALRLAPGLSVGRINAHQWAVSARGFNDTFANKLLVLMDGRSIYTPLFSGVWWDVQDTVLKDLDRIEIVRGPGASLWGANAVNGIINIISKKARDTQGLLVSGGSGSEDRGLFSVRYGSKIEKDWHFRVYGKYADRDDSVRASGEPANDNWWMGRGGFRADWEPSDAALLTLQGEVYAGRESQTARVLSLSRPHEFQRAESVPVEGGHLLGRWSRQFSEDSDLTLQAYYDRTVRSFRSIAEERDTWDIEFQHRFPAGARQELIWGTGYRYSEDEIRGGFELGGINDTGRGIQLFNVFLQDEITLVEEKLRLTLGAKIERNDFTGFEFQPSGRLLWTPGPKHSIWTAISRAVRTPSRGEDRGRLVDSVLEGPIVLQSLGSTEFGSEVLIAYEAGYRWQVHPKLSLDAALFYNDYDHLRSVELGSLQIIPGSHVLVPFHAANQLFGEAYGGEFTASWQAASWWRLQAAYSLLLARIHTPASSTDSFSEGVHERRSPQQQALLRSSMNLGSQVELDALLRYVDELPDIAIPGYAELQLRLGWRPRKNLELSIVGSNLFDPQHPEYIPTIIQSGRAEIQRSLFGSLTWRY